MYRVTIDKEACDGIFACLTRDPRFVEDEDGLATIDPDADPVPPAGADDGTIRREDGQVVAEFDDDRIEEARAAAAACPPSAISVEQIDDADAGGIDDTDASGIDDADAGGIDDTDVGGIDDADASGLDGTATSNAGGADP